MATDQALHGLDQLELQSEQEAAAPSRFGRRVWAAAWPKLLAIALVLAFWELVALSGWKHYVLKGPGPVLSNLWSQLLHGQLWGIIGDTLQSAVVGYAVALVIGSVLGLLVARIPPLRAAVGSIITGLTTMPSVVWVPFAIVIFGESYTPPLLLRAGRTMGLRGFALYRYLVLPASLPAYVAGMKQGWAFAWRSLMAGEIVVQIVGQFSIGQALSVDQQNLDFTSVSSLMIVILVIGIVVDALFSSVDRAIRRRRGLLDAAAAG